MATCRPAGLSDEDDTDDYDGYHDKPFVKRYSQKIENPQKQTENQMQNAIISGNTREVEKIIISNLNNNLNIVLDSGWTPLMHACFHGQEKVVDYLLSKGADPNVQADSLTPLMMACSNQTANEQTINAIVNKLIASNCVLNIGDKHGQTPLMRAISNGHTLVAVSLVLAKVNIEMRDNQGWTALFWAVHHNRITILEMLLGSGARVSEVDRQGRSPMDIAEQHGYQDIIEILRKHLNAQNNKEMERVFYVTNKNTSWHDYYPGLEDGFVPDYSAQIPSLLHGMNCDQLMPTVMRAEMDLRSFLLLDETELGYLDIKTPHDTQKVLGGLRRFHTKDWRLKTVSGLYLKKADNYGILECLSTLGAHLHQTYVLEASLAWTAREYDKLYDRLKYEPNDSPVDRRIARAAEKLRDNIATMGEEVDTMIELMQKINDEKPGPVNYIREPSTETKVLYYCAEVLYMLSAGLFFYQAKRLMKALMVK